MFAFTIVKFEPCTNFIGQLTGLGLNKVELCGKGYAIPQVFDSIWGDVPLHKIYFDCNNEYQYLSNWKVLQKSFLAHGIVREVHADKLSKCKMQDNLEFLQFAKKYWDQNYSGEPYDAEARRRSGRAGARISDSSTTGSAIRNGRLSNTGARLSNQNRASHSPAAAARGTKPVASMTTPGRKGSQTATVSAKSTMEAQKLNKRIAEMEEQMAAFEKERDFYFNKLRQVEVLTQTQTVADKDPSVELLDNHALIERIQAILYSTEVLQSSV